MSVSNISFVNTKAVSLMAMGRCTEAASVLSNGIKDLHGSRMDTDTRDTGLSSTKASSPSQVLREIHLQPSKAEMAMSPHNPFLFYHVAFDLVPGASTSLSSELFQEVLSAVSVYNLALIQHHEALAHGSSRRLRLSLSLYQSVYHIIRGCCRSVPVQALALAVTANMAQIHAHHFSLEMAEECNEIAMGLLLDVGDTGYTQLTNDICEQVYIRETLQACHAPVA
jgi:hypothetical protein